MDNTDIKEELEKNEAVDNNSASVAENEASAKNQPAGASDKGNEENKLKEELAVSKDKYIRLYSEFENYRRRTAKEKLEMIQSANEQLIKSLLPVLDDFERAEKAFKESNNQAAEGFLLISAKYKKVLELYGVKTMDIQQGFDFDPDVHEAITQIPSAPNLKGKVVEVIEKGYLLNDKVIRFAKVVVGS
jgi:molecular chaperone GrpE